MSEHLSLLERLFVLAYKVFPPPVPKQAHELKVSEHVLQCVDNQCAAEDPS